MSNKLALSGIITALVTPLTSQGEVDEEALREIVRFQLKHKIDGFFPCGTTGLGLAMCPDQRKRVAEVVVEQVEGYVPVIVQVGASDSRVAFELAARAEKIGADAVASLTPFYYQPGDEAIVDYFKKLCKATALPVFVYNIPGHTGNNVDGNLLLKVSKIHNIIGVKDSSRDFAQLI